MSRVTSLNLIPSKQALALFILTIASLFALTAPQSKAQFTFAADSASNYGGPGEPSFSSGQNGGTGFSSWNFRIGGNAGAFIGNPGVAGISGLNADSFGLYANPAGNNYIDADRSLAVPMGVGDRLSFLWGVNWDSGGSGAKGFNIYAGGTQLINVNMGGTETITVNGTNTGFGYGTAAMSWSFFYENNNTLAVTASDRDGNGVYSNSFSVSGGVSSIRWYANNLADNNAARQPYFNNLLSTNSGIFSMGGTVTNGNAFRGAGSLAVGNSTTLVIGGYFNDYTGATIISNGSTLRLVAGSIDGWGQTPSSPISNDGTLAFDSGNSYVSGVVSGIGAVTKSGNGMAQLRQNNTYSGLTTIYSGILEAWRPDALGSTNSGTVVMQGGA